MKNWEFHLYIYILIVFDTFDTCLIVFNSFWVTLYFYKQSTPLSYGQNLVPVNHQICYDLAFHITIHYLNQYLLIPDQYALYPMSLQVQGHTVLYLFLKLIHFINFLIYSPNIYWAPNRTGFVIEGKATVMNKTDEIPTLKVLTFYLGEADWKQISKVCHMVMSSMSILKQDMGGRHYFI